MPVSTSVFFGKAAHPPLFGGYGFSRNNGWPRIVAVFGLILVATKLVQRAVDDEVILKQMRAEAAL